MNHKKLINIFICFSTLASLVSCDFSFTKEKQEPIVTIIVNGSVPTLSGDNNVGEFFIKDTPTLSYIIEPSDVKADYLVYKDNTPLGLSVPKEAGNYKYEVTTKENNLYKSVTSYVTFTLKENPDHVIFESAPSIRVTTEYTDESTKNSFATWPNRNNKASWYDTDCNIELVCDDPSFNASNIQAQIRVRGNYTSNYTKKPFRLKFNSKTNLFGLNNGKKFKKWCLLADVKDSSMMRNLFTFTVGKKLLNSYNLYSSDYTPVHLYLNNEYWGLYLLCEQQEVKSYRVGVNEVMDNYQDTDIGYFFEYDGYYNEELPIDQGGDPTFTINYHNHASVKDLSGGSSSVRSQDGLTIKSDIYSTNQVNYLKSQLEKIYDIMYYAGVQNKAYGIDNNDNVVELGNLTSKEAVERVVNIPSLVDTYIINEIACDLDLDWSSFYMSLDMSNNGDKKLRFEAPWDWDSCYGIRKELNSVSGSYICQKGNPWLKVLVGADWFKTLIKERLQTLRNTGIFDRVFTICEDYVNAYESDYASNYTRWPGHMGHNNEVSSEVIAAADNFTCQRDAYNYFKNWTQNRIQNVYEIYGVTTDPFMEEAENFKYMCVNKDRYEAEDSLDKTGSGIKISTGNNSSNSAYLGGLANKANQHFSFHINSDTNKRALVVAGLSAKSDTIAFKDMFSLELNDNPITLPNVKIPGVGSAFDWHNWTECYVAFIDLTSGNNILKFITTSNATNFDYIDIYY